MTNLKFKYILVLTVITIKKLSYHNNVLRNYYLIIINFLKINDTRVVSNDITIYNSSFLQNVYFV